MTGNFGSMAAAAANLSEHGQNQSIVLCGCFLHSRHSRTLW
jgi:hypothetical protein